MSYYGTPYMGIRDPLSSTDQSGWPLLVSSRIRTQAPNFLHLFIQFQLNVACLLAVQPAVLARKKRKKSPSSLSPSLDRLDYILPTWTPSHAYGRSVRAFRVIRAPHVAHVHVNLITVGVAIGLGFLFLSTLSERPSSPLLLPSHRQMLHVMALSRLRVECSVVTYLMYLHS
jgi:hypothetical protein